MKKSNVGKKNLSGSIPCKEHIPKKRKLGLLENKAAHKIHKDFKISEEEFLQQ